MPRAVEALAEEVLNLPPALRTALLDLVIASLDPGRQHEAACDALAARREAELEAGAVNGQPLDAVLARLEADAP